MNTLDKNKTKWLNRWSDNRIGFHLDKINPNLQTFWPSLGAQPGGKVFVPLCGKSLDMLWLQQQNLYVSASELSPVAVSAFFKENEIQAQKEQLEQHERWHTEQLEIFLGDFFALPPGIINARYIYDRAALIALPPELQQHYATQLINIAPNVEKILLTTIFYDTSKLQGPPFSISKEHVRQLFSQNFHIELLCGQEAEPSDHLRQRGMDAMIEYVFRLERR